MELGDTGRDRLHENKLRSLEHRLERLETQSLSGGQYSARLGDKKLEYLEEKLIETTDVALKAEKHCLDLELLLGNQKSKSDGQSNDELKGRVDELEKKTSLKFQKIQS